MFIHPSFLLPPSSFLLPSFRPSPSSFLLIRYFIPSELPEHLKRAAAAYGLDFRLEHDARKGNDGKDGKDGKGGKKKGTKEKKEKTGKEEEDEESTHDLPTYAGSFEPTKDGTAWVGEPSCTHAQVKV